MAQQHDYYRPYHPSHPPRPSAPYPSTSGSAVGGGASSSYPTVRPLPTPQGLALQQQPYSPPTPRSAPVSPPLAGPSSYRQNSYAATASTSPDAQNDSRWGSPQSDGIRRPPSSPYGIASAFEPAPRPLAYRRDGSSGSQPRQTPLSPPRASAPSQPSATPPLPPRSPNSPHFASNSPTRSFSPRNRPPLPSGTLCTATADHDSLSVVPLAGLSSIEAIKDVIMSRLHIADEDMPRHAFYLTRIGGGEGRPVGDDELWDVIRKSGEGGRQVTVFVKEVVTSPRREEGEFAGGMSAERMRQVAHARERERERERGHGAGREREPSGEGRGEGRGGGSPTSAASFRRHKSPSVSSRSDASSHRNAAATAGEVDEFGQVSSPGERPGLRSDRPMWASSAQPATWSHMTRGTSASEGQQRPSSGSTTYSQQLSPPGVRHGSGVRDRERGGDATPTPTPTEDYFRSSLASPPAPAVARASPPSNYHPHLPSPPQPLAQSHGSSQVVMGPSGPTRRLPPQPQQDKLESRQRMQTAPSIQVSSPGWNRVIPAPQPQQPVPPPSMLTRPSGVQPHPPMPRPLPPTDPRSSLPQYNSQPYKNLPHPNSSPYHNLSLQGQYQPISSTVNVTYTQHASPSLASHAAYNAQHQHAQAQQAAQQRMMSKSSWSQPARPLTMYDLSTGQVDLKPGEVLQQQTTGSGGGGGRPRRRSELPTPGEGYGETQGPSESMDAPDRRSGRDELKHAAAVAGLPASLQAGGPRDSASSYNSQTSPTAWSSPAPSAPPFLDDDGAYDGIASPDRAAPVQSPPSSARSSASGPLTPANDAAIPAPIVASSSRLDEFGDPIDEETSTWFPVNQPQPLPPALLAKPATTVPLPASSPYGGGTSSPMRKQLSGSSGGGGGSPMSSSNLNHNHERRESVPTAQDWQQTILSRFGASSIADNDEGTLTAAGMGTLRPFEAPKVVDEFGDELEDDSTFFPGFGPAAPSSPQGNQGVPLRADPSMPHSPTHDRLKRPNLRLTIDTPTASDSTHPSTSSSHANYSESSPPLNSAARRSAGAQRYAPNSRLDDFVRLNSSPVVRRNSFAAREKDEKDWAFRPPVETVLENLDVFFPEHDLDKPVFDLPTPGSSTPSTGSSPVRDVAAPISSRRGGAGGASALGYRKSIRVVALDRKRMLQKAGNNVARAVSGLGSNLLRRKSTKLFGARIEEVTSAQMKHINAIKETSDEDPENFSYKWIKGDLIGRGTYGHVYIALSVTTGETIAVKQVEMPRTFSDKEDQRTKGMISSLKAEIELLKDLDHPSIVLYLGMEQTPEFLSIFLEYVPGGSVGRIIRTHGKFEENVIKFFTLQILDGLEYLHSLGILHRDMKADNILIDQDGMCKISDFGTSKKSGERHISKQREHVNAGFDLLDGARRCAQTPALAPFALV
ncbi:SPOSA6832_00682 [Sporobolomyces salmonicolor]|uniref:SPOSA6832_00682-mRNA-1:cds n=1 Tax=Sporidiobolus salmonicolor TaxID=5005 RepID=A0A0D6EGW2_SPOSA|nr:SPOSA6832_00682 [Sporobolomyces salmonicolor]